MSKTLVRLTAVLVFALCTSACSTLDSAYDDILGDSPSTPAADSSGFPPDAAAPPATTADAGTTPDLASVPDKPSGTTTPDDQREVADSLAADRARATYSSDALRGGTEAAAPPPGPPGAPVDTATVADNTPPPSAVDTSTPPSTAGSMPPPAPDNTPAPAPTTAVASLPAPLPPGSQPAVPANGGMPGVQPTMMADAQLGFKPSTAPALDPSISQFVARPIIDRYQQTASNGGVATGPIAPLNGDAAAAPAMAPRYHGRAVGGPEAMTGSVVANFDAINGGGGATPSVYANASGMPPTAVVFFPGDTTALNREGKAQVEAALAQYRARGSQGYIKVVGHSSSRTANMSVQRHLAFNFDRSQARANAVARALIAAGVPASKVLVEAVGDSQPVYYESMPQGEEGNRRAEIFIQG